MPFFLSASTSSARLCSVIGRPSLAPRGLGGLWAAVNPYFDRWPGCADAFFLGLPLGQPPFLAFRRAAAVLARLVAFPACAAKTLPMTAPHLGHFNLLIRSSLSPMPLCLSRPLWEANVRGSCDVAVWCQRSLKDQRRRGRMKTHDFRCKSATLAAWD